MLRSCSYFFRQNSSFIFAFFFGIGISIILSSVVSKQNCDTGLNFQAENINERKVSSSADLYEPKINLAAKPKSALKAGSGMIRPRFHKAELGVKNKLFLGVLTSPESIATLAVALNKTVGKFVNKIMFFIDAPSAQRLNVSLLKLPGIVGFTDTRKVLKPFHLIKYVSDNFLDDYDFFFIIKDTSYVHAQKLNDFVRRISIMNDVHVGKQIKTSETAEKICSLDFGVLLSNLVIKKMQRSLEWCAKNSASKDDSVNFGKCVIHASQVPCVDVVQGLNFYTYHLQKKNSVNTIPTTMEELQKFDQSVVISPLYEAEQYFTIHFHHSMASLQQLNEVIGDLRKSVLKSLKLKYLDTSQWPVASQPATAPTTHFDVLRWDHFNLSHKYLNNDFSNLVVLSGSEKEDVHRIVSESASKTEERYDGALKFFSFINGYQKFDPSRGMDYIIDLAFRETTSGKIIPKRLEVFKSLGKVEMVPVPYVTENVRVHVIMPVKSTDIPRIMTFLKHYSINAMEKKDLQFLMLVFIYDYHESSKGEQDIFKEVKNKAFSLSNKFEKVGNLIKWHSIKLPANRSNSLLLTESLILDFAVADSVLKKFPLESLILFGRPNMEVRLDYFNRSSKGEQDIFKEVKNKAFSLSNKFEKVGNLIKWHSIKLPANRSNSLLLTESLILDFAVADSVLKKFPLESLILFGRPNMEVRLDYFNRVRMNTVSGFQVFSAVPFSEYHPEIIYNKNHPQSPELDINKNYGHYDSTNFKHISFYTADYFKARKNMETLIPIVRSDKDVLKLVKVVNLTKDGYLSSYTTNGIYDMFLRNSKCHVLRAVEPSLRLRYPLEISTNTNCTSSLAFNLATRSQLGRIILDHQADSKNLNFS